MAAISGRMPPVDLAWDTQAGRTRKTFADAVLARRTYARLLRAGRNPTVINPEREEPIMPATKTKPTTKRPAKPAKPDWAGSAAGTQAALINAQLTTKPRTLDQLIERTNLARKRVRSHMDYLIAEGYVVRSSEGYARKARKV